MTIQISPARINNNATSFKGGASGSFIIKSESVHKFLKSAGGLSTPANRLLLGATALAIQPEIDLHNKDVDEKTRRVSFARTVSKIVVGTATGIAVRVACIKSMEKFTRLPKDFTDLEKNIKHSKWEYLMIPSHLTPEQFQELGRKVSKHRQALGSIAALGVMLITNFIIDAPLTKVCTNLLVKNMDEADKKKAIAKGGN